MILVQNFHLQVEALQSNAKIFGADMDPSVHIDNKNKDIFILGEITQRLDHTTSAVKAKYPINFTQPRKILTLSLHYNVRNSFFFANATKIYKLKAKDSVIKHCVQEIFQKILQLKI